MNLEPSDDSGVDQGPNIVDGRHNYNYFFADDLKQEQ